MRVLILMILAFGFLSCDSYDPSKPTTFCKIKGKEISYIINNPPDDTLALKIEVEKMGFLLKELFFGENERLNPVVRKS